MLIGHGLEHVRLELEELLGALGARARGGAAAGSRAAAGADAARSGGGPLGDAAARIQQQIWRR
eukprot:9491071-Pyramimonas_sp.AAC.1